jgi:hypothetical protein
MKSDAMARTLAHMSYDDFSKDVSKLNKRKTPLATTVGGVSGEEHISNMFRDHYMDLLNSVSNQCHKPTVDGSLANCEYVSECM